MIIVRNKVYSTAVMQEKVALCTNKKVVTKTKLNFVTKKGKLSEGVLSRVDTLSVLLDRKSVLNKELKELDIDIKLVQNVLLPDIEEELGTVPETVTTPNYTLSISKNAGVSALTDKTLAIEYLNNNEEGLAFDLLKYNLTDLKTYLTPEQYNEVTTTTNSGRRLIKVTERKNTKM